MLALVDYKFLELVVLHEICANHFLIIFYAMWSKDGYLSVIWGAGWWDSWRGCNYLNRCIRDSLR
jgi:hypothetical protein